MASKNEKSSELNFHPRRNSNPVWLTNKPSGFWLFRLDLVARLGPSGRDEAHYLWPEIKEEYKGQYNEEAIRMKCHNIRNFYPDPLRVNQVIKVKSCWDKAFDIVRSERAGGIGLDMTDIDHLMDVFNHMDHLK